jgi:transcription initiation factor TFIIIB Brf1 subunit/transcription initiation factor TFIIB
MYRASDQFEHADWLDELEAAAEELGLGEQARSRAGDLFLSNVPDEDRSKHATMAACLYVGALVSGQQRTQTEVAEATGVSRLSVQQRWKDLLEDVGLDAPDW